MDECKCRCIAMTDSAITMQLTYYRGHIAYFHPCELGRDAKSLQKAAKLTFQWLAERPRVSSSRPGWRT